MLSEADLSLPPHMGEVERLRSVITVKDACIANFSTTLRSIEKKAAVERETLESHIAELETQLTGLRALALENSGRQRAAGSPWTAENSPSGSGRVMDGASTPGEIHARMGSQSPSRDMSDEVNDLREKFQDIEKEKNKMEGRVLRAEASSADLLKELRSTYFQLDKTRAQLQEVMNTSDSRSPPGINPRGESSMPFEKEQQYQREIAELQLALRRAKNEITNQARYGRDVLEVHDETVDDRMQSLGRELDLLSRTMGITNTDQLPVASKIMVLKKQVETWRDQREKEGKLLEDSKKGMMELLNEFKLKDQQLKEAQAVIAGKGKIFLSKPKENKLGASPPSSDASSNLDPGTVGFTISGQAPFDILDITHLLDRNGTPQGAPGCLNRSVMRGDRLLQVGGLDVTSAPLSALKAALGGTVDSCVTLRLFRAQTNETFDITARRHVLMSPRSRAAVGRQLPVSPRSLAGSLPVSPRNNLSSNPITPRNIDATTGLPMSPRTVGNLPLPGGQLSSLAHVPLGQHMPMPTSNLAGHGPGLSPGPGGPGPAMTLPTNLNMNMNLASHTPGPAGHSGMMPGMPGQWSPSGAGARHGNMASVPPPQQSSYFPLSPASPVASQASFPSAHARGPPIRSAQPAGAHGGGGVGSGGPGSGHRAAGAGTPPAMDPWALEESPDGNIWTTNPGNLNPSLVLT